MPKLVTSREAGKPRTGHNDIAKVENCYAQLRMVSRGWCVEVRTTCSFSVDYSTKVSVPRFHFARGVYRSALSFMRSLTVMCRLGLCGR